MPRICSHQGCKKQPSYGTPGDQPTRCRSHAEKDMENVVNKRCVHPGCNKQPSYGMSGDQPTKCQSHAEKDMEDVRNKRCDHPECKKRPSYGTLGDQPTRCRSHAEKDMEDVRNKRCPGYNGTECPVFCRLVHGKNYCISCDPDKNRKAIKKKDEYAFFKFLEKHCIPVTTEQYRVYYRCVETSKKYADIDGVIVTQNIVICLEVDENGHKHYNQDCDAARTQWVSEEILLAYPEHELAWVRVNPTASDNKIRKTRFFEAVKSIRELLESPRTTTIMIGF